MTAFHTYLKMLNYPGCVLLIALLLGGGTSQGLWSDHLIQILLLPALFLSIQVQGKSSYPLILKYLLVVLAGLVLLQLMPLGRAIDLPSSGIDIPAGTFFSPMPGKALESALFFLTICGYAFYLSILPTADLWKLQRYLYAGAGLNLLISLYQLSFATNGWVEDVWPYIAKLGIFANPNHFSVLILIVVPLVAVRLLTDKKMLLPYLALSTIAVLFLFAVGSRATTGMMLVISPLCAVWFLRKSIPFVWNVLVLSSAVVCAIAGYFWIGGASYFVDAADLRMEFYKTTWLVIKDNWLLGTGLGTFTSIYPAYEATQNIGSTYANHAHNDYLELLMELGLFSWILISGIFASLIYYRPKNRIGEAAFLSLGLLCLHSIVDYPLRTMALGMVVAYLVALIFARPATEQHYG